MMCWMSKLIVPVGIRYNSGPFQRSRINLFSDIYLLFNFKNFTQTQGPITQTQSDIFEDHFRHE